MVHTRPSKWIRKGSSFAALRHLPRVGQDFCFREHSWEIEREVLNTFECEALGPQNPLHDISGVKFSDGQLNSIEFTTTTVKATINHFGLECLYSWLYRAIPNQSFPIDITFHGVVELVLLRSTEQAHYQRIRSCLRQTLLSGGQLLRIESIKSEPDSKSSIIGFRNDNEFRRSSRPPTDWFINDYWLLVKSKEIRIENRFNSSFRAEFKLEHRGLLDPFLSDYDSHDWSTFFPFESWLAERGFDSI